MDNHFHFRPLAAADLPMLTEWLRRPHVVRWWGEPGSDADVARDYLPLTLAASPVRGFLALLDGEAVGFIQSYEVVGSGDGWWESETDTGARGIDQFLAHEGQLGMGIGSAMVRAFVGLLFLDPAVSKVQTDPAPCNLRAIRSYAKAGFVAAEEVLTPDGPALLMVKPRSLDDRIIIGAEDPASPDAVMLITQLSAALSVITGDDGTSSFDPDDMRASDALFALARTAQGQAVGCGGFRRLDPAVGELKRMFAVPGTRGVGGAVLAYLEAAAASLGYKALRLSTRAVNHRAVEFYERHGFKRIPNFGKYAGSSRSICLEKRFATIPRSPPLKH